MTTFLRLLQSDDKANALMQTVDTLRDGQTSAGTAHMVDPGSFRQVPGSPFIYWVSEYVRQRFSELPAFENESRSAKQGLATADDFRFVRTWWEVGTQTILSGALRTQTIEYRNQTFHGKRWVPFPKGGAFSPFYADQYLMVNWEKDGRELRDFPRAFIRNETYYFLSGLTWPSRPHRRGAFSHVPPGVAFGHTGTMMFLLRSTHWPILSLLNSNAYIGMLHLLMPRGAEGGQTLKYEIGLVTSVPLPSLNGIDNKSLTELAMASYLMTRSLDTTIDISHVFILPALLQVEGDTLTQRVDAWQARVDDANRRLAEHQREIDDIAFRLYGIDGEDRRAIEGSLSGGSRTVAEEGEASQGAADEAEEGESEAETGADARRLTSDLLSWAVGSILGRWDVRLATGERPIPELPDPFAPLPVCSPGMLTGEDGLPLRRPPSVYPLKVDWDGILVDDPEHNDDIVRRVRDVLDLLWGERAESIEREACDILGVKELRNYFRDPKHFWDDHIKRYSKSRRKAPIYWLLQSPRKHYGIWLYYHRLDSDILFKALHNYVEPKISGEENLLAELLAQHQSAGTAGKDAKRLEKDIDRQEALLADLREFRDRLERAAKLYLTPDLNDGVILNIAPLWELVPWKEPKSYWEDLLAGKYEWSSIGKQLREKRLVTTK